MIRFAVGSSPSPPGGQLVYRRNEFSFDTEPSEGGRAISIAVNEVQLFVDDGGRVIYVSGYCPYHGWDQTSLTTPKYRRGDLIVVDLNPGSIPTGMGFGLNDLSSRWPVYVNPQGWVCIGDSADQGDQAVEFAPNCVAVLRGDSLVALWLHPRMVGSD